MVLTLVKVDSLEMSEKEHKIAIVGSTELKFTAEGIGKVEKAIIKILKPYVTDGILVSGGASGVDSWAVNIANNLNIPSQIYWARVQQWLDKGNEIGFRTRNLKIAKECTEIWCIVPDIYPPDFIKSNTFKDLSGWCYHCDSNEHIPSGGCWTARNVEGQGKRASWIIIKQ